MVGVGSWLWVVGVFVWVQDSGCEQDCVVLEMVLFAALCLLCVLCFVCGAVEIFRCCVGVLVVCLVVCLVECGGGLCWCLMAAMTILLLGLGAGF